MELPITYGFAPEIDHTSYDIAIYKNTGDYRSEKLSLVHGVEAT
jgi:hypothetical protein